MMGSPPPALRSWAVVVLVYGGGGGVEVCGGGRRPQHCPPPPAFPRTMKRGVGRWWWAGERRDPEGPMEPTNLRLGP